jgi:cellulose synthase/poly-beta-1,6-N-acetylglucosamine synthase-like glycosyltransferase
VSRSSDTLVFIPAWNEEASLPDVLDELSRELPDADVLVVDDGSTDRTAEIARARGASVLGFEANQGHTSGAPEVESLIRLSEAGLTVHEVPVNMRERASGESKLRGKTAVKLVLTVVGTLLLYRRVRGIWPWPTHRG